MPDSTVHPLSNSKPCRSWRALAVAVVILIAVTASVSACGNTQPSRSAKPTATAETRDLDGDGIPDARDPDSFAANRDQADVDETAELADSPAETAPAPEPEPEMTASQENAVQSAQSYLDMSGFSKKGLIQQLSSSAGEGFPRADAVFAVKYLHPDWRTEAVESARSYLRMGGFSRQELIEQLSSDAGEGFTYAQAVYAVNKAYH